MSRSYDDNHSSSSAGDDQDPPQEAVLKAISGLDFSILVVLMFAVLCFGVQFVCFALEFKVG